ncbi:ATP-binding cassette domain-containing protein [Paraconexibacter antarcticus]|uniref:ATP-binding cassette domain-containing protein n=1 Tax=Paraconexibacter antarcticus TaxID=2949664 RepID=A0ABY5E0B0_9ACTN|nr:ATP-binding cassette domain-containing protein [Paraconexibacter antarcticus]UTI66270.1 ATP-binding cassette domain-containing protein [Paraconexibacter antarcticus]
MSPAEPLVRCTQAARTFGQGRTATVALSPTDCVVLPGDRIALVGPSGSGKSTLLHLMAGLDDPTRGEVTWPAIGSRDDLRPGHVAVVFQGPTLLAPLTVIENVALPLILDGDTDARARATAREALGLLGLAGLADKLPEEISGGQAQRVAVARALAGRPALILADEPTGQLDRASGQVVTDVLLQAADHAGAALVISTHDMSIAQRFAVCWQLHSGQLTRTTADLSDPAAASIEESSWSR